MTENTIGNTTIDTLVVDARQALMDATKAAGDGGWSALDEASKLNLLTSLGDLRSAIAELTDAQKQIEALLKSKSPDDDPEDIGGFRVSTSPNRTFDKAGFAAAFPPAQRPDLYKQEVNLDAVKKAISPNQLDLYYDEGTPRLNFKAL